MDATALSLKTIFVLTQAAGREECVCLSFVLHIYIVPLTVVGLKNLKGKNVPVFESRHFHVAAVIQSVIVLFIIVACT